MCALEHISEQVTDSHLGHLYLALVVWHMSQAPILLALTVMSIHYKFTISKNSQFSKKKSWCVYYENITDNGSNWDNPKSILKQNRTFLHKFLWNQSCQKQNNLKPFSLYVLF